MHKLEYTVYMKYNFFVGFVVGFPPKINTAPDKDTV